MATPAAELSLVLNSSCLNFTFLFKSLRILRPLPALHFPYVAVRDSAARRARACAVRLASDRSPVPVRAAASTCIRTAHPPEGPGSRECDLLAGPLRKKSVAAWLFGSPRIRLIICYPELCDFSLKADWFTPGRVGALHSDSGA